MREPSVAVALRQLFCRDEAPVGAERLARSMMGAMSLRGHTSVLPAVLLLASLPAAGVVARQAVKPAVPIDPVDGILQAFKTHDVVMLPGGHGGKGGYDLLLRILRDPRTPGVVTDVVVEFGTSRYQDVVDRFMRGEAIPDTTLRHVWQDTTIPGVTNDGPYVEEFYRAVRVMNADLPKEKRYRVLGGDPPIDWDNIVTAADVRKWTVRRDTFAADLIHRDVVERGRRALVVYGPAHFPRREVLTNYDMSDWQAQTMTSLLEGAGIRPFVIQSDSGKSAVDLQPDIASWPVTSLTLVRGTVLGAADFTVFNGDNDRFAIRGVDDFVKIPKEQYKPMRMEDLADAILWNGVNQPPTPVLLSKATCADPAYLPMRLARIKLAGLPQGEADAVKKACGVR
jgi:hypothetical protein